MQAQDGGQLAALGLLLSSHSQIRVRLHLHLHVLPAVVVHLRASSVQPHGEAQAGRQQAAVPQEAAPLQATPERP